MKTAGLQVAASRIKKKIEIKKTLSKNRETRLQPVKLLNRLKKKKKKKKKKPMSFQTEFNYCAFSGNSRSKYRERR